MRRKIAMIMGSFDPIHFGHYDLGNYILKKFTFIEKVVFVPVNNHFPKEGLQDEYYRYNLIKSFCNEKMDVSDVEFNKNERVYTYDTFLRLKEIYPEYDLYLTIGSDNLRYLNTWKNYKELLRDYKFIVFKRDNDSFEEILKLDEYYEMYKENIIFVNENKFYDLSSTMIRNLIKSYKNIEPKDELYVELKKYMPEESVTLLMKDNRYF